jgi:hypothetical protein
VEILRPRQHSDSEAAARAWRERAQSLEPWLLVPVILLVALLIFYAAVMGALFVDCCIGGAPP